MGQALTGPRTFACHPCSCPCPALSWLVMLGLRCAVRGNQKWQYFPEGTVARWQEGWTEKWGRTAWWHMIGHPPEMTALAQAPPRQGCPQAEARREQRCPTLSFREGWEGFAASSFCSWSPEVLVHSTLLAAARVVRPPGCGSWPRSRVAGGPLEGLRPTISLRRSGSEPLACRTVPRNCPWGLGCYCPALSPGHSF